MQRNEKTRLRVSEPPAQRFRVIERVVVFHTYILDAESREQAVGRVRFGEVRPSTNEVYERKLVSVSYERESS